MATKIRLARAGTHKRPFYRIVVADSRSPRDGKFIEKIGTYNPLLAKDSKDRVTLKEDRVSYWLGTGAVPSDKVVVFLNKAGIGKDNAHVKIVNKKRAKVIKLKEVEVAAKKKKEAEEAAAKEKERLEAEKAAAAEAKAAEEAEAKSAASTEEESKSE